MKKKALLLIRVLVTVSLVAFLVYWVDLERLVNQLRQPDLKLLALASLMLIVQYFVSAFRWQQILAADGIPHSLLFLVKTYLIGNFLSLFLPTGFGGDIYRVHALNRVNSDMGRSTSSVLFDRASGLFALLSISLVGGLFLPGNPFGLGLLAIYVAGIVGFVVMTSSFVMDWLSGIRWRPVQILLGILRSFRQYRTKTGKILIIISVSLLFQFNIVVINKIYAAALDVTIPFLHLMVIIPIIYLTEAVPISINGLGVRESAFAFFFSLLGFSAADGLAVSLLVLVMRYLVGILGGAVFLVDSIRSRSQERVLDRAGPADV